MVEPPGFPTNVFINSEHEFRSGWRVLAFSLLFLFAAGSLSVVIGLVAPAIPGFARLLKRPDPSQAADAAALAAFGIDRLILLLSVLISTLVCARWLEHRSLGSVGFARHPGWVRDVAGGLVIGVATLSLGVALIRISGGARFGLRGEVVSDSLYWFVSLCVVLSVGAAAEELLIRGFPFQALMHNLGPGAALLLTSIGFGLLHVFNPGATLLSTLNTVLAGVWLGMAYLRTRSLWLATALHFAWNISMGFLFGLPISGIASFSGHSLLVPEHVGLERLTGGAYGPEGGVAVSIVLVASTLVIWRASFFEPSQEMITGGVHGNPGLVPKKGSAAVE
jgi:CAAX protease family protein